MTTGSADIASGRQAPLEGYIADFVRHRAKIVIEVDGGQHFSDAGERADMVRTQALQRAGYRVLRLSNLDVLTNRNGVLEMVLVAIANSPYPNPPPQAGEGAFSRRG